MSELDAKVQAVLMEKIERLERELEAAKELVRRAERQSVEHLLRPLRARDTVLLYFGEQSSEEYTAMLQESLSGEIARFVMRDVFFLDCSGLDSKQQTAIRDSLRECRWFPKQRE